MGDRSVWAVCAVIEGSMIALEGCKPAEGGLPPTVAGALDLGSHKAQ